MIIRMTSPITGKVHDMDLPITHEQMDKWHAGKGLIQDIFPELTPEQREFIMTGIPPHEWDEAFKDD